MNFRAANPSNKIEVDAIMDLIRAATPGTVIPYPVLNKAIKGDVQGERRHILSRAMGLLLRERIPVSAVRSVGIKRLDDVECATSGPSYRERTRRLARKGTAVLGSVKEFDKLPPTAQRRHNVDMAILAAVTLTTGNTTAKRIDATMSAADVTPRGQLAKMAIEAAAGK